MLLTYQGYPNALRILSYQVFKGKNGLSIFAKLRISNNSSKALEFGVLTSSLKRLNGLKFRENPNNSGFIGMSHALYIVKPLGEVPDTLVFGAILSRVYKIEPFDSTEVCIPLKLNRGFGDLCSFISIPTDSLGVEVNLFVFNSKEKTKMMLKFNYSAPDSVEFEQKCKLIREFEINTKQDWIQTLETAPNIANDQELKDELILCLAYTKPKLVLEELIFEVMDPIVQRIILENSIYKYFDYLIFNDTNRIRQFTYKKPFNYLLELKDRYQFSKLNSLFNAVLNERYENAQYKYYSTLQIFKQMKDLPVFLGKEDLKFSCKEVKFSDKELRQLTK